MNLQLSLFISLLSLSCMHARDVKRKVISRTGIDILAGISTEKTLKRVNKQHPLLRNLLNQNIFIRHRESVICWIKKISITRWNPPGVDRCLFDVKRLKLFHGLEASFLLKRDWFVRTRVRELRAWLHNTIAASDWLLREWVWNCLPVSLYI